MKQKLIRKKIPSSGRDHLRTAADKKPGRIVDTTWGYGPDLLSDFDDPTNLPCDVLQTLVEGLASSARDAIRQHFSLDQPVALSLGSLTGLIVHAHSIGRIIAKADIPMIGGAAAPNDWPDHVVSTEGMVYESGASLAAGEFYEFDGNGALVLAHFDDPSYRVLVRDRGHQMPITLEETLGAMAALLRAFADFRLSLAGDANEKILDWLHDLARDIRTSAERLRHPYSRTLRDEGSRALEAFCEQFADRVEQKRSLLIGQKIKEPRIRLMGPLQACYYLLFGRPATVDESRTDSPFIRFATAFFDEVGCPCAAGTVGAALDAWRRMDRAGEIEVPKVKTGSVGDHRPAALRATLPSAKIIDLTAAVEYLARMGHPKLIEVVQRAAGELAAEGCILPGVAPSPLSTAAR